ncbi:MAG: helix-turn-helix domain-containing protein [Gammaproteobacteria bacterium]|nr:helix-turn-helix domain-containing protein [Gammaproteobacteria bacterium]MDH5731223.1 helix-turn-helix domain-containing protein [Gammaproteobacteria bacterium]
MDSLSVLYLFGSLQALVLAIALLSLPQVNRRANIFLGLFLFVFALDLFDYFLLQSQLIQQYPHWLAVVTPLTIAYGPLLYFYVQLISNPDFCLTLKRFMHFLWIVLIFVCVLPVYTLSPEQKLLLLNNPVAVVEQMQPASKFVWFQVGMVLTQTLVLFLPFFYAVSIYKRLKTYRQQIKSTFSSLEKINLTWLNHLFFIALALSVLLLASTLSLSNEAQLIQHQDETLVVVHAIPVVMPVAMSLAVLYLALMALRQPGVVQTLKQLENLQTKPSELTPDAENKYAKSSLTQSQAQHIRQQLLIRMPAEKWYCDANLSLPKLANKLNVGHHQLSQVLNQTVEQNFFDFVNNYRIQEAKRLLADPTEQRSAIIAIALQVGFKSKSAFYRLFKQSTGITPSAYRQQQNLCKAKTN